MTKHLSVLWVYLLLMGISIPTYSQSQSDPIFDFGQYLVSSENDCIDQACEIVLTKNFSTKPLVFVMPTITDNGRDAPSTLKITSIYKKGGKYAFKIKQVFSTVSERIELNSAKNFSRDEEDKPPYQLIKIPMKKIAFFAMEPGTVILGNNGRITASSVLIDKEINSTHKKLYKKQKINLEEIKKLVDKERLKNIPIPDRFTDPGAIVAIQPSVEQKNQDHIDDNWLTPFMLQGQDINEKASKRHFYLGVDSSETKYHLNKEVQVGYLFVEGSGLHKGLQFALGRANTPNTLKGHYEGIEAIVKPVREQCAGFTSLSNTDFDFSDPTEKPILFLASKNSRFGPNGGWVRLCNVRPNNITQRLDVSFVNDEDLNEKQEVERRHANEVIGFMAFQRRVAEEVCDVFPGPVQTWQQSNGRFAGSGKINVKGARLKNNQHRLGFKTVIDSYSPNDYCNGKQCFPIGNYSDLYAKKMVLPTWPEKDDGDLSEQRDFGNKKIFWFNKINLINKKIVFPADSVVHVKEMSLSQYSSILSSSNKADELFILVHNLKPNGGPLHGFVNIDSGSKITALIYSERHITMANHKNGETIITGAVTAPEVQMTGSNEVIKTEIIGQSSCFETPPDYVLEITPPKATSTLCDWQQVTFVVSMLGGGELDFNGDIRITINSLFGGMLKVNNESANPTSFSAGTYSFAINNDTGFANIWIKPNSAETITVSANIEDMSGSDPKGIYSFIPGGFTVEPTNNKIIAGKPFEIIVKAVACTKGENIDNSIIGQYSGLKSLKFNTQYLKPKTGSFKIGAIDNDSEIEQLNVQFKEGISAPIKMRYRDAGEMTLVVNDPDCTSESCSLIEGESRDEKTPLTKLTRADLPLGLVGEANIKSRPWTFAICPKNKNGNDVKADGTSSSGNGFVAAGDSFTVNIKPLVWFDGGSLDTPIQTLGNFCNAPITPNFFKSGAPIASVELSIPLDHSVTPKNGEPGELQGITVKEHTEILTYTDLSWSEVGSVRLQANTQAKYLGMDINQGYRNIGRFYPKQFKLIKSNIINAHTESSEFTYMDQPFDIDFTVQAQNVAGKPTVNYGAFAESFKEKLLLNAINLADVNPNNLTSRIDFSALNSSWNKNWQGAELSLTNGVFSFKRLAKDNPEQAYLTTQVDGPYDVGFGLTVDSRDDCITFGCTDFFDKKAELRSLLRDSTPITRLDGQLMARYGRMKLDDVVGAFDKALPIPLKVEYWDGSEFILNENDSRSRFNSRYSCKQVIYPLQPQTSSAELKPLADNVIKGQNNALQALPNLTNNDYIKQQVRFWIRIADKTPADIICSETNKEYQPWLTYNWRDLGDEDPSTLVTFGSYRGNDRIIYRGEKGLNQQSE